MQISPQSLAQLRAEDFAVCVEKPFDVALEENAAPITQLTLISVEKRGDPVSIGDRVPFSLTFQGNLQVPLDQGLYWLKRSDFGVQGIFIVPMGQDEDSRTYEAIFS